MKFNKEQAKRYLEEAKSMRPEDGFVVRCSNGLTGEGYATMGESRCGRAGVSAKTVLDRIAKLETKGRMVAEGLTATPEFRDHCNNNDTGSGAKTKGPGFPSKFPNGTEDSIVYEIYQFDRSQLELSKEYHEDMKRRTVCKVRVEFTIHKDDVSKVELSSIRNDLQVPIALSDVAKVRYIKRA